MKLLWFAYLWRKRASIKVSSSVRFACANIIVNWGVKIVNWDVPQYLDESRGVYLMRSMHLKSEIAQLELSDLCRKPSVG